MRNRMTYFFNTRFIKRFVILILIVLALCLVARFAVPPLLSHTIATQTEAQLGRRATVGHVSFNPFTAAVTADTFVLYEADRTTPAVTFKQLFIDLSYASVFRLAPIIEAIRLDTPSVHLVSTGAGSNKRTNFSDILEKLAATPSSGKSSFSLSNIEVLNGSIQFDDREAKRQIAVDRIDLGLPFLSTFNSAADRLIAPRLSARIDGRPVQAHVESKPFAANQETTLSLDFDAVDIPKYLPLLPIALPLNVAKATLSSKVTVKFVKEQDHPVITAHGSVDLYDVWLNDLAQRPLLNTKHVSVQLAEVRWPDNIYHISSVTVDQPEVWVALQSSGRLNWALGNDRPAPPTAPTPSARSTPSPQSTSPVTATAKTKATAASIDTPDVKLGALTLRGGVLHWQDAASLAQTANVSLANIDIDLRALSLAPNASPATLSITSGNNDTPSLSFTGIVQPSVLAVAGKLELATALEPFQPYLHASLDADVTGHIAASALVSLRDQQLRLRHAIVIGDTLKLTKPGNQPLVINQIKLENANLDLAEEQFVAANLTVNGFNGLLQRDLQNGVTIAALSNNHDVSKPPASATSVKKTSVTGSNMPKAENTPSRWIAAVRRFNLVDSTLSVDDRSVTPIAQFKVSNLNASVTGLDSNLNSPLSATIDAKLNNSGLIHINGGSAGKLDKLQLNLALQQIPIAPFAPYFPNQINLQINNGKLSLNGSLTASQLTNLNKLDIRYRGALQVAGFSATDHADKAPFLQLKKMDIDNIDAHYNDTATNIDIGAIRLDNFYAQALLDETGKLNLTSLTTDPQTKNATSASTDQSRTPAKVLPATPDGASVTVSTSPAIAAPSNSKTALKIGKIDMKAGNINYTDNFVSPHYTANLTDLTGSIGLLSNSAKEPAQISIDGRVDSDAPLLINGAINPFSDSLYLDIKASATGVELPKLSTYAVKYVGYEIEKGKLSMEVSYQIEQGKLVAQNHVRLEQLNFGKKVDSPTATRLPVQLAVSLLKNRDGEINIDLPISGSLDDPQFSVGGLIFKAIINLFVKAVTSPFSLISSAFGGNSETLDYAEFPPGSSELNAAATTKLDTIAKALTDRPALKIDLSGRTDPVTDMAGLRSNELTYRLIALKVAARKRQGIEPDDQPVELSPAERSTYLAALYKDATFDKPRNALGFAKTLSDEDMTALIEPHIAISQDMLNGLGIHRAEIVRNYLIEKGKITTERIFITAPHTGDNGVKDKGLFSRVDFSLR